MSEISRLNEMVTYDKGPVFPAGPSILGLLKWDPYTYYEEVDTRLNYYWRVEVALQAHGDSAVRVRQTINLHGYGVFRKHEVTFAFEFQNLADVALQEFSGRHPGRGHIDVPHMDYIYNEGPPVGMALAFREALRINRWSCLPITNTVTAQEMTVYEIPIWFTKRETALQAINTFSLLREQAKAAPQAETLGMPATQNTGPTSLGGISRL